MENYTVIALTEMPGEKFPEISAKLGINNGFVLYDEANHTGTRSYKLEREASILVLKITGYEGRISIWLETSLLSDQFAIKVMVDLIDKLVQSDGSVEVSGRSRIEIYEHGADYKKEDLNAFIEGIFQDFDEQVTRETFACMPDDTFQKLQDLGIEEPELSRFAMFFWMIGYRIREFFLKLKG